MSPPHPLLPPDLWWDGPVAPQSSIGAIVDRLASFAHEPCADSFETWVGRMVHEVLARHTSHVAAGMQTLVARMSQDAGFRAECFNLAKEALGHCGDRILAGYNQMRAALLASQAAAGELSTAELHDASIRLFNRYALEAFASEHAYGQGAAEESIEVALYLETHLRTRLALPPSADMRNADFAVEEAKITFEVLMAAVAHVQALHKENGSHGLPAFLAGQGGKEFNAWAEHLCRKFPRDFEVLNQQVGDRLEARATELGGTGAAYEQAGVECKKLWAQQSTELVARLTQETLQEPRGLASRLVAGLRKALPNFLSRRLFRA